MSANDIEQTPEQKRHQRYFDMVCNPADWKAPIDAEINADLMPDVDEAIVFYTGTKPTYELLRQEEDGKVIVRVRAIGYRQGPCGDN